MTLVPSRPVSPVFAPAGKLTSLPTKLPGPIAARHTRNEVLETSSLKTFRPSAVIVPVPTNVRKGLVVVTSLPKFDPVCTTGVRRQPIHLRKWTTYELSPKSSGKNRILLNPPMTRYTEYRIPNSG